MSDALCGPSNAVRNLAKHSSVDRTLQQDRLVSRQSPSQGFRSFDPNATSLDPEFEAFQNGHGLAGPSWAASSLDTFHSQPPPFQSASPLPSASWTQDFNRLSISSPQQPQLQAAPQAWHNHFGQHAQQPAPLHAPPARMQMPSASFLPMRSAPHYVSQSLTSHQQNLPQDQFDEAAFEAAFDAALEDASMDHDFAMQQPDLLESFDFDSFLPDIYPHLPLFRLALADALITNTDGSLHRAAKIVGLLIQHPRSMDPVQAMLFRPLLSALNDPKRTLFSQRYCYEPALNEMLDSLAQQTENARLGIDASTEQLLASYADLLWQRTESNHLQSNSVPRSADNTDWLETLLREEGGIPTAQNITEQSTRLLTESFSRQVISDSHSQALSRVLDMEYEVYSKRPALSNIPTQQPVSSQEREAILFNMMEHILSAPETVEALEAAAPSALENHKTRVRLLEQQQQREGMLEHQRSLEQEQARNPVMQSSGELPITTEDIIQSVEEDALQDVMDEESEQQRREQRELDRQNDDELAQTAANLLDRVSDNQTSKFKNSAFLGLMRQLADREVRVEGDKMVPTNTNNTLSSDHSAAMVAQDGQEVVDLLDQSNTMMDQDPEFMMTSPFASADDY
ncbi:hypothetical protein E4T50_15974 [Aureobasidium sp. EXF-12298]|nr:hypothetical protein E4T50_15974 [Aureobasidium sp. EXF-12298]